MVREQKKAVLHGLFRKKNLATRIRRDLQRMKEEAERPEEDSTVANT